MKHPYRIREIAAQSGLSEATVDRVLHGRGGVRESTIREVRQAISDLDRQRSQVRLGGRTFMIDVIVQAPPRFCAAIRAALEAELPALRPAVIRARFHLLHHPSAADVVSVLERVGRGRSHGVILKAPDLPEIVAAARRGNVPLVTLVTDLPASPRVAYAGIDNRAVGATAAYLIQQWLADRAGDVLVVRGHGSFRGEDEREMGFRAELRGRGPHRRLLEVVDAEDSTAAVGAEHPRGTGRQPVGTRDLLPVSPALSGNSAVVAAFAAQRRPYDVFVAHDLDEENTALLRERKLSAVLHHDLRTDLRRACHAIMQAQGALPGPIRTNPSAIQVITPHNTPPVEF
nr:LacI family DNA-binding transcriptional regulator [Actinoplanes digitatis]